jgi:hypothetical protein
VVVDALSDAGMCDLEQRGTATPGEQEAFPGHAPDDRAVVEETGIHAGKVNHD